MLRRLLFVAVGALILLFGGRLVLLTAAIGTPDATAGTLAPAAPDARRVGIVFGAGLSGDGKPSLVLRDRILAGTSLLKAGTVDVLLMTGDNSIPGYNEPGAMRTAAIAAGAPASRIALDYGGRRTWDSCWLARKVFGVRHAVLISSDYHRARTVASCKAAGITVDGTAGTSSRKYPARSWIGWEGRELVASWRGIADAWIKHPAVAVKGGRVDPFDPCSVWKSLDQADQGPQPAGCRVQPARPGPRTL